jgi:malonyl-ACP decarboxylase
MMRNAVIVSGMGVVSSLGLGISEFETGLRQGLSGIGWLTFRDETPPSIKIGAQLRDFSFMSLLERTAPAGEALRQRAEQCARRSPFPLQAAVLAALEAWQGTQLDREKIPPHRLGLIVAGNNLNQHYPFDSYNKFRQSPEYLNPRYALHYMDTDHIGTLSEIFGIQGEGFTVGGASASGNVAIIKAYQLLQRGNLDACLVVGGLTHLSALELQAFYNLGALGGKRFAKEPAKACRPFDRDHEGFIYGQASGSLVLESLESAQKRGVPPLAEMLSGALVLQGNRLSDPGEEAEVRAMESALEQANLEPGQIDYLNTHGTSSPLGDKTEVNAIQRVFKQSLSHVWLNSTKSLTGHCLSAAGVIEAIASIIQMQRGFVHPNLNLENPIDQRCRWAGPVATPANLRISMSNSFGFGGINSSIILT